MNPEGPPNSRATVLAGEQGDLDLVVSRGENERSVWIRFMHQPTWESGVQLVCMEQC